MTREDLVEALLLAESYGDVEAAEVYQSMLDEMDGRNA